jgi:hypothetical protein
MLREEKIQLEKLTEEDIDKVKFVQKGQNGLVTFFWLEYGADFTKTFHFTPPADKTYHYVSLYRNYLISIGDDGIIAGLDDRDENGNYSHDAEQAAKKKLLSPKQARAMRPMTIETMAYLNSIVGFMLATENAADDLHKRYRKLVDSVKGAQDFFAGQEIQVEEIQNLQKLLGKFGELVELTKSTRDLSEQLMAPWNI